MALVTTFNELEFIRGAVTTQSPAAPAALSFVGFISPQTPLWALDK